MRRKGRGGRAEKAVRKRSEGEVGNGRKGEKWSKGGSRQDGTERY